MSEAPRDFIRDIVERDLQEGRHARIVTRFPPEPNGYLHIGHAKSIVLNFGIAEDYAGRATGGARCHLRFDDTNPLTEEERYVEAIQEDVRWLGFDWGDHLYHASGHFEWMYELAEGLIHDGKAYVDSQDEEAIREQRGTVTEPGTASPYRDRPAEESLDLFRRMRDGEFSEGAHVLRARIDMAHPNMLLRDPVLYRILHASHYRTGDAWCVYPMYDYAHPLGDALEGVTHSFCTLEFENNRPLYDWVVENTKVEARPRQYEFARLNLEFTVMSKRRLLRLVEEGDVEGWDDPRVPTIAGIRRRGITPEAVRSFCEMIGVSKADSTVDIGKLEHAVRDDLNRKAPRVLCVLDPLKVLLENYPEGEEEWLEAAYFPHDVGKEGSRSVPFGRELYIDRSDFMEDPPADFKRLAPGREVRLRYGYVIRCDEVVKDGDGRVSELRCTYDPETRGGTLPDGRKVPGTIQWVSATRGVPCQVRLYDRLFRVPNPVAAAGEDGDFRDFLNRESLDVRSEAVVEPSVADDPPETRYQFERVGYFWRDPKDSTAERPVFNRIVQLRDPWARRRQEAEREQRAAEKAKPAPSVRGAGAGVSSTPSPTSRPRRTSAEKRSSELHREAERLVGDLGLGEQEAEGVTRDEATLDLFSRALDRATEGGSPFGSGEEARQAAGRALANWVAHDLTREQREHGNLPTEALPFGPDALARLVTLLEDGTLSSSGAREVLSTLAGEGGDPDRIVRDRGLAQVSDVDALAPEVDAVLESFPDKVAEYRGGKTGLLGFFVGQVMRRTDGRADPEQVKELLTRRLDD